MKDDSKSSIWADFFAFRKMISLFLSKIIYIIGMVLLTSGGLVMIILGLAGGESAFGREFSWTFALFGLAAIFIGNLLWRLFCEYWVVFFSMHEQVVKIAENISSLAKSSGSINEHIPVKTDADHHAEG
jgi:hypothetical protein